MNKMPFFKIDTQKKGFTLIELMFAVAIIGVVVAYIIPDYVVYNRAAINSEALTMTTGIRQTISDYYAHRGRFPADNKAAGLSVPELLPGRYVKSIEVENGAIHVQFNNIYSSDSKLKVLTIRPSVIEAYPQGNSIAWLCGHAEPAKGMMTYGENRTSINRKYLPRACW